MEQPQAIPLAEARRRFFDGLSLPSGSVSESILQSWQRCRGLGLPASGIRSDRMDTGELSQRKEANADWLQTARPLIDTLFENVVDDGHVVIVADRHGVILDEMGHPAFLDKAERVALTPGMDWSEDLRGTNAIGTALRQGDCTLVRGGEHYLDRNRLLSCVASPILDPFGQTLGALDVSGMPRKLGQQQALAVQAASRLIEQRLFDQLAQHVRTLWLHADPAQLNTPRAGRLAFDEDEKLLGANRQALAWLKTGWDAVGRMRFADLFGETLEHWLHRSGNQVALLQAGQNLYSARLQTPPAPAVVRVAEKSARAVARPAQMPSPSANLDDAGLPGQLLATAIKLLEADIPVLLLGETGSGKDQFARRLHQGSSRQAAPLVAVNCAALPEGLVEAELFGYEEGAFTGARRQGSRGRLREAHGGILFLDEIGDMPLTVQARLLRVLQDKVVTPLGGGASHAVDFRLVCATHRNLQAMVAEGSFRADLYYRLCHYPLSLPALRERGDVAVIAQRLLDAGGGARRGIRLSVALATAFRRYAWPGNVRQLANLLTTLLALVDDHTELTLDHLPPSLRDDMSSQTTPATHAAPSQLETMLKRFGGNASAAARAMGISRSTFYRRLKQG